MEGCPWRCLVSCYLYYRSRLVCFSSSSSVKLMRFLQVGSLRTIWSPMVADGLVTCSGQLKMEYWWSGKYFWNTKQTIELSCICINVLQEQEPNLQQTLAPSGSYVYLHKFFLFLFVGKLLRLIHLQKRGARRYHQCYSNPVSCFWFNRSNTETGTDWVHIYFLLFRVDWIIEFTILCTNKYFVWPFIFFILYDIYDLYVFNIK